MKSPADRPKFTFAQVRSVLAETIGVDHAKMKTFEARLQQLQKLGLPTGTNVGRSGRAQYSYPQVAEILFYLDLLDSGATPALLQVHFATSPLYSTHPGHFVEDASNGEYRVAVRFNALGHLRNAEPGRAKATVFDLVIRGGSRADFLDLVDEQPSIVINLTRRIASLKSAVANLVPSYAGAKIFPGKPGSL